MGSYKPYTHPHPPTLTHTHPHSPTPTHNQPKKGHIRPHPSTGSQKKDTPIQTQTRKSHTHSQLAKKRTYPPKFSHKCREKKIFHYPLGNNIFVRNSRSHQYQQINRHQYLEGRNFGRRKFLRNRFSRLTNLKTASLGK